MKISLLFPPLVYLLVLIPVRCFLDLRSLPPAMVDSVRNYPVSIAYPPIHRSPMLVRVPFRTDLALL